MTTNTRMEVLPSKAALNKASTQEEAHHLGGLELGRK